MATSLFKAIQTDLRALVSALSNAQPHVISVATYQLGELTAYVKANAYREAHCELMDYPDPAESCDESTCADLLNAVCVYAYTISVLIEGADECTCLLVSASLRDIWDELNASLYGTLYWA